MAKKILVVDDTKNIRNLLITCLELEGYQVKAAEDGQEALEFLTVNAFDLAFLDIKLPKLSGTEVLRRIRDKGIATPVIIMTAFATVKNAVECTKLGAVAYLQKPFTAEKIRHVMAECTESEFNNKGTLNRIPDLITAKKHTEAFDLLKRELSQNPNNAAIYYWLARVYEAQGDIAEASRFDRIARQFEEPDYPLR